MSTDTLSPCAQNGAVTIPDNPLAPARNGSLSRREPRAKKAKPAWQIVLLPVERIQPNPFQPRLAFDETEMAELVASVREYGVQQPILVRTCPTNNEHS